MSVTIFFGDCGIIYAGIISEKYFNKINTKNHESKTAW